MNEQDIIRRRERLQREIFLLKNELTKKQEELIDLETNMHRQSGQGAKQAGKNYRAGRNWHDIPVTVSEQELFLKTIFDTARSVVLIVDTGGRIHRMSPFTQALLGFSEQDLLLKEWYQALVEPEQRNAAKASFQKLLNEHALAHQSLRLQKKDKTTLLFDMFSQTFFENNNPYYMLIIGYDRSEHERTAKEIAYLLSHLKKLSDQIHEVVSEYQHQSVSVKCLADFNLSKRQTEIARLLFQGKQNKEIAAALGISESAVKSHVFMLFKKTGVGSRVEFIRLVADNAIYLD